MSEIALAGALRRAPVRILARFGAALLRRLFADGAPDWTATIVERLELVATRQGSGGWDFGYEITEAMRAHRLTGETRWLAAWRATNLLDRANCLDDIAEDGPGEYETEREFKAYLIDARGEAAEHAISLTTAAHEAGLTNVEAAELFVQARWPIGVVGDLRDAMVAALCVGHDRLAEEILRGARQAARAGARKIHRAPKAR